MEARSHYEAIRQKSLSSIKWTYGSVMLPLAVSPIVTTVLAAILGPTAFGVVAIASLAVSFVDMVKDNALTRVLVRSEGEQDDVFSYIFWLSLTYGVLFYTVLLICAPVIARMFHCEESVQVLRVLGFQMIFTALCTGHNATLIRTIDFKRRFKIDLFPSLMPLLVAIPLAFAGMGVWSLVIGYLSSSFVRAVALWVLVPVRPHLHLDSQRLRTIALLGLFCSVETMFEWFFAWGDRAIVGCILDVRLLGIYTFAITVAGTAFSICLAPLTSLNFPVLCKLKDNVSQFNETIGALLQVTALLTFPIGIVIFVLASAVPVLIGAKWMGIETPLRLLAVSEALTWTVNFIVPSAVRAKRGLDIMPKFHGARLVYTVPLLAAGAVWGGLEGFCYAKLGTAVISCILFMVLFERTIRIPLKNVLSRLKSPFLCACAMALCAYAVNSLFGIFGLSGLQYTVIVAVAGLLAYFGFLIVCDPPLFRSLYRNIAHVF